MLWLLSVWILPAASGHNLLMVTLGGTRSHTVPFASLAKALVVNRHNVTLLSGFPGSADETGAEEFTPVTLAKFIREASLEWDFVGRRARGEDPVTPLEALSYAMGACRSLTADPVFLQFLNQGRRYDLIVLDGAYTDCAIGLAHHFRAPYMFINTVAMYTSTLAIAGNPEPFAITPFFNSAYTDQMSILERMHNAGLHAACRAMHWALVQFALQPLLRSTFGPDVPSVLAMQRDVSFVLQNSHPSVTYPRAYLPNVAEVACIHCRPPRPLSKTLEEFVAGAGEHGAVVVSMGSSVRSASLPMHLRHVFARAFAGLPQRFIWKWEAAEGNTSFVKTLPSNVMVVNWLPQQDLLGHPGVVALVSHGGLLSMFETVYHGKPMVSLPVFCDHDANAAKAEKDGYAIRLEIRGITSRQLSAAISTIISDSRYKEKASYLSQVFRDQPETPLQRAVFWTEYVLRHKGALHLQGFARHVGTIEWLYLDVLALLLITCSAVAYSAKLTAHITRHLGRRLLKLKLN